MTMMNKFGWHTFGATVTGSRHKRLNRPNDDAYACIDLDMLNVSVISDGLGSRKYSSIGSELACRAVCEAALARKNLSASAILSRINSRWVELTEISGCSANDCEATCLFAYRKGGIIRVGRLGDGFIGVCFMNGRVKILTDPKDEHDINETECLSQRHDPAKWETAFFCERYVLGVVLCTDGVAVKPECLADFSRDCCREYARVNAHSAQREVMSWLPGMGFDDDSTISFLLRRHQNEANSY